MTLNIYQHREMMITLLQDIYKDPSIGSFLGFKGGTAALLFYDLPRFSIDLDFDLLDHSRETIVFERIKSILENYGKLVKVDIKRYTLFYLLSYNNKIQNAYNVKVEISRRSSGSQFEVRILLGIPMLVMVMEDMVANKMVAMLNRIGNANRDIFDTWYFLRNRWPINKKLIKERTGMSYKEFLHKCIEALDNDLINRNILSGLGELLTREQKVWAKSKLRNETIFMLRLAHEYA